MKEKLRGTNVFSIRFVLQNAYISIGNILDYLQLPSDNIL